MRTSKSFAIGLLLALLVFCAPRASAWSKVQSTAYTNTTATSISATYASNNTSGNLLIAFVSVFGGFDVTSIDDTRGNTWIQAGTVTPDGAAIYYVRAAIAGSNTVTIHKSTSNRGLISVAEYSGVAATGVVLDQTNWAYKGGASSTTPSQQLIVSDTNRLVVGEFKVTTGGRNWSSITSGFTAQTTTTSALAIWADNTAPSAGLVTFGATISSADAWSGKMVSFVPSGVTPPTGIKFLRTVESDVKQLTAVQSASAFFPGGNGGGNLILVVICEFFPTTNKVTTPTDTAGNTYTLLTSIRGTQTGVFTAIYYTNSSIATTSSNTVTTTWATADIIDSVDIFAAEFTGQAASNILDTTANATANGSQNSVNYTISAAVAGELLYTVNMRNTGNTLGSLGSQINLTYAPGPNINQGESTSAYLIPSVAGSNSITCTWGGNGGDSITLAIKQATSGVANSLMLMGDGT